MKNGKRISVNPSILGETIQRTSLNYYFFFAAYYFSLNSEPACIPKLDDKEYHFINSFPMKIKRAVLLDFLHLFALVGFAVAQPLYDLLGQNPEFFVAHRVSTAQIIGMVALLSVGMALGLIVLELAAWPAGERVRRGVHWVLIFSLSVLIALPMVKQLVNGTDYVIGGVAFLIGLVFVVFYVRWQAVRLFVTVLSPAVVAFPLWFLMWTPVSRLIMPDVVGAQADIEIENPVPVVLVVLDEFNATAWLDAEGRIDPVRFPNFAALAAQSWWFPNAVAASELTERAVPAILTGRNAKIEIRHTPTATDHPQNLFTMLGEHYHLNVWESVTTLCPDALCRNKDDAGMSPPYAAFIADVAVIYLHIITPPLSRRQLPSLDSRWTGFGGPSMGEATFNREVGSSQGRPARGTNNRDSHLSYFLSQIAGSPNPELHFLHVLLPHVTYEYLSSGHRYSSDRHPFPEGFIEGDEWIGEEPLIVTAYHRNLQQIGYLDRFLGQLRETLEASGLYDKGLIIVTADHGVAFQRALSRRGVQNGNESDILKIPMIVKLPGQREEKISERLVTGVDVLPTIVDVLGVRVPWDMDGRSMFSNEEAPRTKIVIPGVGHFQPQVFEGFPRLRWQVEHFGDHTALDRLVPKGPYPLLIRQPLTDLAVGPASGLRFYSGDVQYLEHVNPASGFLPALFRAYIVKADKKTLPLAIALNDRIWATTTTSEWDGKQNFFSVLLPPAAFKEGKNRIGIYRIEETGDTLLPVEWTARYPTVAVSHGPSGQLKLVYSDRREIPIEGDLNGVMRGALDSVNLIGNMLVFAGWGADMAEARPATEVLIFTGEQLVSRVKPESSRPDISEKYEQQDLLHSGFHMVVPVNSFKSHASEIMVVLLSQNDRALKLSLSDEHQNVIHAALEDSRFIE